jgi:hypothetical protein
MHIANIVLIFLIFAININYPVVHVHVRSLYLYTFIKALFIWSHRQYLLKLSRRKLYKKNKKNLFIHNRKKAFNYHSKFRLRTSGHDLLKTFSHAESIIIEEKNESKQNTDEISNVKIYKYDASTNNNNSKSPNMSNENHTPVEQPLICACGSTTHARITHTDCSLNKKKSNKRIRDLCEDNSNISINQNTPTTPLYTQANFTPIAKRRRTNTISHILNIADEPSSPYAQPFTPINTPILIHRPNKALVIIYF